MKRLLPTFRPYGTNANYCNVHFAPVGQYIGGSGVIEMIHLPRWGKIAYEKGLSIIKKPAY
jgi:hypothetical protein